MDLRTIISASLTLFIAVSGILPRDLTALEPEFSLEREPLVRIGLLTNSRSALISTRKSTLAALVDGRAPVDLGVSRVRVSSRKYRPPVYEIYTFETDPVPARSDAAKRASDLRKSTGEEVRVEYAADQEGYKLEIGQRLDSKEQADEFLARLAEKGVPNARIRKESYTLPSDDAIALTSQIRASGRSKVRSLITARKGLDDPRATGRVRTIASSRPTLNRNRNARIDPSLREVNVSGSSALSTFASLRPVTIGAAEPGGFVRLNGKSYRGQLEVFVNAKGRISVVNVVGLEDYLLGVVPAELSLPQIEAQKAQAVAARTYAVANRNGYGNQGFDMLPTVWSQVYKGVSIESRMGTRAVLETRGVIATYRNRPINALYTSTCGGRTENSGNIFEFDEPYLRGVECSLEPGDYFRPFIIKTNRQPAVIRNEANYELVRLASRLAVNNFLLATQQFDDDYFEDPPSEVELTSWLNQIAKRVGKTAPSVDANTSKPIQLARALHRLLYSNSREDADTLLSDADVSYHLSFLDSAEVPGPDRPMLAQLLRDGYFTIYSDLTIKPHKRFTRGKILRLIDRIHTIRKWSHRFDSGTAKPTEDGKLVLRAGRREKEMTVNPNVYLFRRFGNEFYQVRETALVGGESLVFKTNAQGEVVYLEVRPTRKTTVAERSSPFTIWRRDLSASTVRNRLSRYVKGLGTLIDLKITRKGVSRRATELEIITTNGVKILSGGKIRSALRLREQLFVMNKKYGASGRVARISFTGRGWGHGVGMCQYGAYGFAKMGLRYGDIIRHYYTGVELTKAY